MSRISRVVVTLPGGRRVDAQVGQHVVHTDQPKESGGDDAAPSPFDLFLASMGTCAGIFVQGFCAKRGIPYQDIRVLEHLGYDEDGVLNAVDFEIQLAPGFPAKYREAIVKVVEQCSVKRAILSQPSFRVRAEPAGKPDETGAS